MDRIVIVGAGGHGRECADIVRRAFGPSALLGIVDDRDETAAMLEAMGLSYLGPIDAIGEVIGATDTQVVVAMGLPAVRRAVVDRLGRLAHDSLGDDHPWPVASALVDPTAVVSPHATIGSGFVAFPHTFVSTNAKLGAQCHLNVGAAVSHDCAVGDFVTLSPGVMLNGSVTVGDNVFFGTRAVVLPGCTVGDGAVVGAGAVVTSDVPARQTWVGVPARPVPQSQTAE